MFFTFTSVSMVHVRTCTTTVFALTHAMVHTTGCVTPTMRVMVGAPLQGATAAPLDAMPLVGECVHNTAQMVASLPNDDEGGTTSTPTCSSFPFTLDGGSTKSRGGEGREVVVSFTVAAMASNGTRSIRSGGRLVTAEARVTFTTMEAHCGASPFYASSVLHHVDNVIVSVPATSVAAPSPARHVCCMVAGVANRRPGLVRHPWNLVALELNADGTPSDGT
ncbi:uncharacterized protein LOC133898566 isoform X2 [Phragmites australis]|uniref:uncharacterized protein LOC133898566 isoform X2 n=1 Tax=Phragmites australis TaxID=29695 RepID=UPI002D78991E|nr:uncharacterized protein LOC133898566 isoform X2 [Phragmites australis]